jgi:hypothetical protein
LRIRSPKVELTPSGAPPVWETDTIRDNYTYCLREKQYTSGLPTVKDQKARLVLLYFPNFTTVYTIILEDFLQSISRIFTSLTISNFRETLPLSGNMIRKLFNGAYIKNVLYCTVCASYNMSTEHNSEQP